MSINSRTFGQSITNRRTVGISAHRGAMPDLPENTLATYRAALAAYVDYIEIDVRTTKDGHLVILHDGSLDRTTDGHGPIKEKTLAELRMLSAGKGFTGQLEDERIPTLAEVCQLVSDWNAGKPHKTNLYVDCKDVNPVPLVEQLKQYNLLEQAVFYGSDAYLLELKQVAPSARLMPSLKSEDELTGKIDRVHPYAFDVAWPSLTKKLVEQIHQHGIKVFSDALGPFEEAKAYQQAALTGIDVIQTDYVHRVVASLTTR